MRIDRATLMVALVLVCASGVACSGSAAPAEPIPASTRGAEATPSVAAIGVTATAEPTVAPAVEVVATSAPTPPALVPTLAQPVATQTPRPPEPTSTPEAPVRPPPVTVSTILNLSDRSFMPHQIHGNADDTVVLTFMGGTEAHTFTVTSLGIDVSIGARETKQFSFAMPVEGEVPFFCRLHGSPTSGMHGLLIFH